MKRAANVSHGLALALLFASHASANDSTFGGGASDLVPLEETRVRMLREDILLEYRKERDRWHITARYVFQNLGDSPVGAVVGFPEYRCIDEYQDCLEQPFENLQTEVDGRLVPHRRGHIDPKHEWKPYLGVVWLYDVTFPGGKVVNVLHSYSVAAGGDVEWNKSIDYVTRTGAKWADSIGQARFTFRLPSDAHTVSPPDGIELKHIRLVEPDGPDPYVEVVLEQASWNPTGDLSLSFNATALYLKERLGPDALTRSGLRPEDLCPPFGERDQATDAQLRMCRNDDYAIRGYPFKREALQRYYYGNPFSWRKEPAPWDPTQVRYVRGLRPLPGLAAWAAGPVPENAALEAGPAPAATATKGVAPGAQADDIPSNSPPKSAHSPRPPPAARRPLGCSTSLPSPASAHWWLAAVLVALRWRRLRTEDDRGDSRSETSHCAGRPRV